jgi:hypothetical protein
VISKPGRQAARMAMRTTEAASVNLSKPRSRTDPVLEMIALCLRVANRQFGQKLV